MDGDSEGGTGRAAHYGGFDFYGGQRRWNAKWVWKAGEPDVPNSFYMFRKEFDYGGGPARICIAAETRYRLYVNGRYAYCGSLLSFAEYKYYDDRDIVPYLREGRNTLAVVAYHMGRHTRNAGSDKARGGLLAEVVGAGGETLAATDETWSVRRAGEYGQNTFFWFMATYNPYQEAYDSRGTPAGWALPGYDDGGWERAAVVRGRHGDMPPQVAPWAVLQRNDLPVLECEATPTYAESVYAVEEVLDYDNRMRYSDLSILLSVAGEPVRHSTVGGAESLLGEGGETIMSCSTGHIGQRPEFDGVYSPYVILDFGKVITAFLEIEAEGVDGAILDIGYSERLIGGHFNISIENPFADRLIMGDGALTYRPFTWKAFRYVRLQLRESYGITKIRNVKAIISTYPYEVRGSFESSDPKLNRLYEICRRTVRLCSNEGIMDTPWREQGQFTGDASMVTLGVVYSCFGDTGLIGKYLRQCAETQQITGFFPAITNMNDGGNDTLHDYNLHYINALYEHYVYTGDRGWVDAYYPHVCKAVSAFMRFRDGHGMFDRLPALFLDWINLDRMGSSSTFNALMYATLGNVLEMARLKADRHMAGLCGEARERIKGSFDGRFLDRGLGLYRDGNHGDGLTDGLSEHANCAAILFGLADAGTAERIVDKLYVRKDVTYVEAQPFFTSIVLKALAVSGRMDLAVGVLRDRWVRRMVDKGASSVYEEWTANGSWRQGDRFCKVMRTESHAWSAFPAEFLIRHVAGLRIVEPGGGKVSASPIDPGFDFTAVYPLACGEVGVTCEKGSFRLEARGGVEIV